MIKNIKWLFLVSLTFIACNDDEIVTYDSADGLPLTAGTADFSNYVALGDSYAAGFSDGALFVEGQKGAYPNILAQQFALVGGGTFTTPLMSDNTGGFIGGNPSFGPRLAVFGFNPNGTPIIQPALGTISTNPTTILTGSYNNMGVPGAKSFHLDFVGYGSSAGNPYFARFASTPGATVVTDALAQNPTFFSLWIGGNDVLGYALSGGDGTNPITPTATFNGVYNSIISKMTAGGRKGVIANLPYVNSLPHFTTVPANPVPLTDATQVAQLNGLFGAMNASLVGHGQAARFQTLQISVFDAAKLTYSKTNPLLIVDESLTYDPTSDFITLFTGAPFNYPITTAGFLANLYKNTRHANATGSNKDYIVLSASGTIGATQPGYPATNSTIGVTYPMPDSSSVTYSEVAELKTATDDYNAIIQAAATANDLAFMDAKAVMDELSTTGITSNNYTINSSFVTGGAFSLDGFHPTPRGYALIANEFIKAINAKYGSNLKGVNIGDYRILFPRDAANF